MLSVTYSECHIQAPFAECHYAQCRYAECYNAMCCGAVCFAINIFLDFPKINFYVESVLNMCITFSLNL
jgi:hypothetical protein